MNNKDINYCIYSVESRKGGVGKTTMALNLSKALIAKGYKVLYLDCDISGTPISEATEHSFYWSQYVNAMHEGNGIPSNLLNIFREKYQTAESSGSDIIKYFDIKENKINIIGSDIYNEDRRLIIDPRNLMDEMTSYWLLNMLKQLAEAFSKSSETPTAIVIDNSPGYVGLAKGIRDWMTSLGPKFAHFLLVSSLDEQDFNSVVCSAEEIKKLMQTKWDIAKGEVSGDVETLIASDSSIGQFYYSVNTDYIYPSDEMKVISLASYIGIMFNKIPESLANDNVVYNIPNSEENERLSIIEELIPLDDKGFPQNTIGYDPIVSEQFISSKIAIADADGKKDERYSNESFIKKASYAESLRYETNKVKVMKNFDASYRPFISKLAKDGYVGLSKTFQNTYTPSKCFNNLYSSVREFSNIPLNLGGLDSDKIDDIRDYDELFMRDFLAHKGLTDYDDYFVSLLKELHQKTGSNRKKQSIRPVVNLSIMLKLFYAVQYESYNEETEYRRYLIEEYRTTSFKNRKIRSYINSGNVPLLDDYTVDYQVVEQMVEKCFMKFYKAMCYALVRMIDGVSDYSLVLAMFQKTLNSNYPRVMNKPMKDYVKAVVVDKTKTYNEFEFLEVANRPFEMQEIQGLITNNILSKWMTK